MSRMTRAEYLEVRPSKAPRQTVLGLLQKIQRAAKRKMIADGLIEDPATKRPKYDWHWTTLKGWKPGDPFGNGGVVQANTKGEARALIKKALGIKHRLTMCEIVRVDPNADASAIASSDARLAA